MSVSKRHAVLILVGLVMLAGVALAAALTTSNASADDYDSTVVQNVLPGASLGKTFLSNEQFNGSDVEQLNIQLSQSDTAPSDPTEAQFYYADRAWRGDLAAADIAMQDPQLAWWAMTDAQGDVPADAVDFYNERVRLVPGNENWTDLPELGTLDVSDANSQIFSNAGVLKGSAPAGTFGTVSASRVTIDSGLNSYAYVVTVNSDLAPAQLLPEFGNIFNGLQTGLVGDESGLIDGMSIVLRSQGEPLAGAWIAERAGTGDFVFSDQINPPDQMVPTDSFPNLTGGPASSSSATSGVMGQ
jgi:hypothetical protein